MKRIGLSFFLLIGCMALAASGVHAQAACGARPLMTRPSGSAFSQFGSYRSNFEHAVNDGNARYAEMHRMKLVSFLEREVLRVSPAKVGAADATTTAGPNPSTETAEKSKEAEADVARKQAIVATFRDMKILDAEGLAQAKSKLGLLAEYEKIMLKQAPPTN